MSPENKKLAEQLRAEASLLLAGHPLEACFQAVGDLFAGIIAHCAETPEQADQIVDQTAADLKCTIRANWPEVITALTRHGAGHG